MTKTLKISRIVVSLIVFAILGIGMAWPAWTIPGIFGWLKSIQLGWAVTAMSLTIFATWMIITLVFGRIYCSSACPVGTLMDVSSRTHRIFSRRARQSVYRYSPPNNLPRYLSLALMVGCGIIGFNLIPSIIDPMSAFHRICNDFINPLLNWTAKLPASIGITDDVARFVVSVSVVSSIVASTIFTIVILVAAWSGRTLCNTVCPIGAVLGLVSRYSIFQINIDTDKCTQCRRCEYVCRSHCINLSDHVVDTSRCVNCFSCLTVCDNNAIRYTTDRKRLSQPLMQRVSGIAKRPETETSMTGTDNNANPDSKPMNTKSE